MTAEPSGQVSAAERRSFLVPLALAQFICSFAGSNMNVMISDITEDLDTSVEISGLSRSVSNLGSSLGTAIAGTILVSDLASGNDIYVLAMIVLGIFAFTGLGAAALLPGHAQVAAPPGSHPAPS